MHCRLLFQEGFSMLERMNVLEKEILHELQRKEAEFFYEVRQGKVRLLLINASWR